MGDEARVYADRIISGFGDLWLIDGINLAVGRWLERPAFS